MSSKWNLDVAHSEITFKVKHMMIAHVTGNITKFNAEISDGDDTLSHAKIKFTAALDSISTGDEQRDGHLKSADFFDVAQFPELRFESTSFSENRLTGMLTIRDITKEITLHVEDGGLGKDPWGNTRKGFTVSGNISRKEWGLTWNAALETGGVLVSDDVRILCEIQFVKG
jgi:polyisoprenoid-binding protein YceI